MVKGDRQIGAARVPHRWSGRVAVAVSVGVAGGVPLGKSRGRSGADTRLLRLAQGGSGLAGGDGDFRHGRARGRPLA
jgi:hypothetical protein